MKSKNKRQTLYQKRVFNNKKVTTTDRLKQPKKNMDFYLIYSKKFKNKLEAFYTTFSWYTFYNEKKN